MAFGFPPPAKASLPVSADSAARLGRMLELSEWASAGIPLLRNPREVVAGLHDRHVPQLSTAVVAVLDPQERVTASASFTEPSAVPDGWEFRNALLAHLRRVIPHDLRLRAPVRTAVLLYCRAGDPRWTEADGAWMWGLRDACTLHGLRCGAYITLTHDRWQVLGEDRGGRRPRPAPVASPRSDPRRTEPTRAHSVGPTGDPSEKDDQPGTRESRALPPSASAPRVPPGRQDGPAPSDGGGRVAGVIRQRTPEASRPSPSPQPSPQPAPSPLPSPLPSTFPSAEQQRSGSRDAPRRSGGGAAEAQRHTAAR